MQLAEYMRRKALSDTDVAAKIGRSRPTVSRIRRGAQRPDWDTVAAITSFTKGAVRADDFVRTKEHPHGRKNQN